MITAQLLARYDDAAGSAEAPVPVSALLAHLLYLRANGGLDSAIALADTFRTAAFVEVRRRALYISTSSKQSLAIKDVRAPEEGRLRRHNKHCKCCRS